MTVMSAMSHAYGLESALPPVIYTYVGLEEFDGREDRWQALSAHSSARQRYALIVDSGAEDNVSGSYFLERFIVEVLKPKELDQLLRYTDTHASFYGIGDNHQQATTKALVPIGVGGDVTAFETTILEGEQSQYVPALLGLKSLTKRRATLHLDPDIPLMEVDDASRNRVIITLVLHAGHILMPIDEFDV